MAQTGYTPILIYSSTTASQAPSASNLTNSTLGSELAINITDGKLFYKDNGGSVQVIGWKVVPATAGGTGQTSYAVGDLLYADTTTSLAKLADVATGNALISGGVSTAPSWGKIGLTTHVSGTLGVGNGGTGTATAFTAGSVVFAGASGVYTESNANFFYDATNNRLGLGTATPSQRLHVNSSGAVAMRISRSGGIVANSCIEYYNGTQTWNIGVSGTDFFGINYNNAAIDTALFRVSSAGDITVSSGNIIPSTAAKGINFTANTAAAGKTSQLLNWYEEGTWTPTIIGSSTNPTYTTSTARAIYTRIGRVVYIEFLIIVSGVTAQGTGGIGVGGLPFDPSVSWTGAGYSANIGVVYNDVWDVNVRNGYARSGSIIYFATNAVTQTDYTYATAVLSTGYFSGSGFYMI